MSELEKIMCPTVVSSSTYMDRQLYMTLLAIKICMYSGFMTKLFRSQFLVIGWILNAKNILQVIKKTHKNYFFGINEYSLLIYTYPANERFVGYKKSCHYF